MVPTKDSALKSFGTNFSARITAMPTTFGLVAADATAYAAKLTTFVDAYDAMIEAREAGIRSKSLTETKEAAKQPFLDYARSLYGQVQANDSVLDSDKTLLGIVIRSMPSPKPAPGDAPSVDIQRVNGRTVSLRIHDASDPAKRARPANTQGAAIFSFVGETSPASMSEWKFEGNVSKTFFDVTFPATVPGGSLVWFTSMWIGSRMESGPATIPVSVNIAGGLSAMAA